MRTELIHYNGWDNCIRIENDAIRLIITTEVGPRIIHFSRRNGGNVFQEFDNDRGVKGGLEWRSYGGHRLWHSPQVGYRPSQPDNDPVHYAIDGATVKLTAETEKATGVQKTFKITLHANEPRVTVKHSLTNKNMWPIEMAAWALSVMHAGGTAVLPVPQNDTMFLPNYMFSFWPWTKPNDHRLLLGEKTITVRQDTGDANWFKIGLHNPAAWGAYIYDGNLFFKTMHFDARARYPDFGANFEIFADNHMLELETLSPLQLVEPNASIEHTEDWYLLECNATSPESIEAIVHQTLKTAR